MELFLALLGILRILSNNFKALGGPFLFNIDWSLYPGSLVSLLLEHMKLKFLLDGGCRAEG
jgi:hypothetical protein